MRSRSGQKACVKRLARLISYIHRTSVFRQYCYVGNTARQCGSGLFQDSDFAGDLEDSKSTSGGIVSDTEGSSSSRTRLREKAVYHHEHRLEQLETLFNISQQLILNHGSEICGISTIGWHHTLWRRSTLQHDRAIKLSQAMVHVYSDSVLCLGKRHAYPCSYGKNTMNNSDSKNHQKMIWDRRRAI